MGNQLYRKAKETVTIATQAVNGQNETKPEVAIDVAKNALSSAFANSTVAEQAQLHDLQDQLDSIQQK
jgi:SRSO17 transposase